jgi:hypothetical protein
MNTPVESYGTPRGGFASSPLQGQQLWPGKAGSTLFLA